MKKASSLMIFLLMACITQAELVDDFEDYELGAIGTVTTTWTGAADGGAVSTASIVVDPVDAANKAIQLTEGGGTGQQWVRSALTPAAAIDVDETSTLYFRAKVTAAIDSSFGLTDNDTASNDWAHFRLQFVFHNAMQIRESGGVTNLAYAATGTAVPWNTDWYNIWLVITNSTTSPIVKVYIKQADADASEADRCVNLANTAQNTFNFRVNAAGALDRVFWRAQNNANSRMIQIDNISISSGADLSIPSNVRPYGPSVMQTPGTGTVDAVLHWNAGADPAGVYAVNPDIVNQYVFTAAPADTTLYYRGATGVDPGTEEPASQYALNGLAYDTTYRWAIVEAIAGYVPTSLTVGVTPITAIDPNNIIGPTWSFESLTSSPVITQQPAQVRVEENLSAVFTCLFTSASENPVDVLWYKSGTATPLVNDSHTAINLAQNGTAYTATLAISNADVPDQGDYYCTINNLTPLVTSNSATLVINRLLAEYDFEGSLAPTTGSASDAPTGQGKSVNGLADANSLLATNVTLDFVPDQFGQAVQIDPNQYIDFGINGYPRASSLAGQIGGGLDAGTIVCWVKPDAVTHRFAVLANYNLDLMTGLGFTIETNQDLRMNIRGENAGAGVEIMTANGRPDRPEYNIFDGQWHLLGVTWDAQAQASAVYVDGQWVANDTSIGTPTAYAAWQRGVLTGAGRQGSPNRHLLTDFFSGLIDNLRIYNYRKTANDIAKEYYDARGILPCQNMTFYQPNPNVNFDNSGDSYCKVDVADLIDLAESWMASGLYTRQ